MYTTLYLILGHFLADFPFQSSRLVKYKEKHFGGVVLHSLTHLVATLVLLIPFLYEAKVWIGVLTIFVMHNVIDQIKISINKKNKVNKFLTYTVDQISHLIVILLVGLYYIGSLTPKLSEMGTRYYSDQSVVSYALILVLTTYFYDITLWTYRNSKSPQAYKRDYALIVRNFIIVTVAFVIFWVTR